MAGSTAVDPIPGNGMFFEQISRIVQGLIRLNTAQ